VTHSDLFRLFMVLTCLIGYGQEQRVELAGTVSSQNNPIANILIVNTNSNTSTITDHKGFFMIEVKPQDTLQVSAVQYITKEILITAQILDQKILQVALDKKVIQLDEVVVRPHQLTGDVLQDIKKLDTKPGVTAASLGLPKAKIKAKTKNERLLFEADDGKLIKYYGVAVVVNVTKLLNKLSGRTKQLKNRIALDEHIKMENTVDHLFSKKALSQALGIPQTNIDAFLDFCIHQPDFATLSETMNALQVFEYFKTKSHAYKKANGLH